MEGGAAMGVLMSRIRGTLDRAAGYDELGAEVEALGKALGAVSRATKAVGGALGQGELLRGLANATPYLDMFGHVIVAWLWLEQATVASDALAGDSGNAVADPEFYAGKLAAFRFFFRHELPKIHAQADLIASLDDTVLGLSPDAF